MFEAHRHVMNLKIKYTLKNKGRMTSSGMLRHVTLVRTDIPEELGTSIIGVTRIG
jgi:hypothetical protein